MATLRAAQFIAVEQVVGGRIVLVDGLQNEARVQHLRVELQVGRRLAGED